MNLSLPFYLLKEMGPRWVFYRGLYWLYQRTRLQQLFFPARQINFQQYSKLPLDFSKEEIKSCLNFWLGKVDEHANLRSFYNDYPEIQSQIKNRYTALKAGRFTFFSKLEFDLGLPPNWFLSPQTSKTSQANCHWTKIRDFDASLGDIKFVWELSRFAWVYDLVRYYVLTEDEEAVELFWYLFEDWITKNFPEKGPHWKCGQEIAMRSLAVLFVLQHTFYAKATTPTRIRLAGGFLRYNAQHIKRNFWYANRSIKNNHTISEAAGLYLIGNFLKYLKESAQWRKIGKRTLEREIQRQVYIDGTYLQHSFNYERLVVQWLCVCLTANKWGADEFSREITQRLRSMAETLYQLQDEHSGQLPNYGANDGTLLQPLTSCDYLDYRPQLQAAYFLTTRRRLYVPGIWDELLIWLQGVVPEETARDKIQRITSAFEIGGYYILRLTEDEPHFMLRCANYHHRPGHADMLHLDFWYGGVNVLTDSGTFSYFPADEAKMGFVETKAHNTVWVDGRSQMDHWGAFLWTKWTKSKLVRFVKETEQIKWEGEVYDHQGIIHNRSLILRNGLCIVRDRIVGNFNFAEINWNVNALILSQNDYWQIQIGDRSLYILTNYQLEAIPGEISRYYGHLEKITRLHSRQKSNQEKVIWVTLLAWSNAESPLEIDKLRRQYLFREN